METIVHVQFDELPIRRFTLPFQVNGVPVGTPPALNASDKVSMVLRQGSTDRAIKLTVFDLAARQVDWIPAAPENATVGTFDFRIRVTQADGKSYSHPGPSEDPWKLTIKPSTATTDITDPA